MQEPINTKLLTEQKKNMERKKKVAVKKEKASEASSTKEHFGNVVAL